MALREDSAIPAPTGTDLPHNLSQPGQRLPARGSPCPAHRRIAAAGGPTGLPVLTVDEPIYRRLPAFLIATVDKFAAMPWVGSVGSFFGRVERADNEGFYGPADPGQGTPLPAPLPPPDLIIQDELHLISGPTGSIAGLYETALEALCCREVAAPVEIGCAGGRFRLVLEWQSLHEGPSSSNLETGGFSSVFERRRYRGKFRCCAASRVLLWARRSST